MRILMLEDNALDAELVLARLGKAGLQPDVTLTHDRREFLQALAAPDYDLVLADYALPDFDGMAALALTRERLAHVPFIFISGRVGEEVAIETLQRGATDYVLKHRLERLVPAVLRALREAEEHSTRMQAEQMFRESELRFHHVIDAVPQMIWVSTADGQLVYRNRAWQKNAPDGLAHWFDPRIFHPDDHAACLALREASLARMAPVSAELRMLCRLDGTFRWHLVRLAPMQAAPSSLDDAPRPDGEQPVNWLGTATDLQDQKLNEEALRTAEKLSVMGRMTAAIAHEINNPLESLTNLLFIVKMESGSNEQARAYLRMADEELERISSITRQTLQFYRDPAMPVEIDARQIFEEVLLLFKAKLMAKAIDLDLRAAPGILFQAIKGEIRQVLINLVNNAIDAVQQQGTINVEAAPTEHEGRPAVCLLVHDNGCGITEEQSRRLFTPFFSTKGAQGTGLGLWVSRGIAEKHGGTLQLTSSGVDGSRRTTACVVLPLTMNPVAEHGAASTG